MLGAMTLALLYGISSSIQGPTNAALATHVGRARASLVSFFGGVIVLSVLVAFMGSGNLSAAARVPSWQLCTGLLGFVIIVSTVYSTPRLGIALTLMIFMFAKLFSGTILDAFGVLGLDQKPLSPVYSCGLVFVALGIVLVSIGRMRASGAKASGELRGIVLSGLAMTMSGVANATQAPILAMLAASTGRLEASLVNFIGGLACAIVYSLIARRLGHAQGDGERVRPWQVIGGVYGAFAVVVVTAVTPILGVGLLVSLQMCGQLLGGTVIDARGWLGCKRISVSTWRLGGIVSIAVGAFVLALA